MSNVFISHSSIDKPFVLKLATSLLNEGLPVWLDSWRMAAGDSLIDSIYDGIDGSSMVILVMSEKSIESGWVNRELNAALSKEQSLGRKFLVPIKIEECEAPLKVADRLYADFSQHGSYSQPVTALTDQLVRDGLRKVEVPPERELIGLTFTRGVHLDTQAVGRALQFVKDRQGDDFELNPEQIVVNIEPGYRQLVDRVHHNIDTLPDSDRYTPQMEQSLKSVLQYIRTQEEHLARGIAMLLNNTWDTDAYYWFAKKLRVELLSTLRKYQLADDESYGDFDKEWENFSFISSDSDARFYEEERMRKVNIRRTDEGPARYFYLTMEADEVESALMPEGRYYGPEAFYPAFTSKSVGKYVYPQMVHEHLIRPQSCPEPIWDLENATIGIA